VRRSHRIAVAILAVALGASPAEGYVRSRTSTGTPLAWEHAWRGMMIGGGPRAEISDGELLDTLRRAMANWNDRIASCGEITLSIDEGEGADDVAYDGQNTLLWRTAGFCDDPDNVRRDVCAAPEAAAITTMFFVDKPGDPRDGEIVDADMVLNAIDYQFSTTGAADRIDLEAVLTHELGHFLGLGHTCHTDRASAQPLDAVGQPVPLCFPVSQLDEGTLSATMFNFISRGETSKRDPLEDEWRGLCEIYSGHDGSCDPSVAPRGCGCATGGGTGAQLAGLPLLLFVLLWLRRRS
jgi:MYXO-CTERM domain-containing protein